jgi:hypothetical protein
MSFGFRKFAVRLLAFSAMLMLAGLSVHAQSDITGAIGGTITDTQKLSLPAASITATNIATNSVSHAEKTDSNGRFLISNLAPGIYSVEVEAGANFANYKQEKVIVEVGRTTNLEIQMGVAGKVETVNVTAEAPVVNRESNDFATNIDKRSIDNMPLNIRRWSQFALLTPGAVQDGTFGDVSFRGISGLLNNVTVDGADDNQAYFAEEKGRTRIAYSTSANAVQEFQVNTSDYSAEYGRSAGGVVNAVTKSGSNTLHGTAFYYNRDNAWAAFNPFATAATQTSPGVFTVLPIKPPDERQQLGGDIGGWLIKNKLFWYFNYDEQLHKFPGIALPTSPTVFFTGINVAAPVANPVTTFNPTGSGCLTSDQGKSDDGQPVALGVNSKLPEGAQLFCRGINQTQTNAAFTFLDSLTGTVARTGNQGIYFPKLEWKVTDNNDVTVSFNRMRWRSPFGIQTGTVVSRGIDSFGDDFVKADTGVVRWTWTHGSSLTNEARFNYGRDFEFEFTDPPAAGEPVSPLTGLSPQIDLNGSTSFTFGAPNFLQRAALPDEHRYQGSDTVGWNHGKHFIKFGFDINDVNDRISNLFQGLGEYSYSDRVDFISDYAALTNHINGGSVCATQNAAGTANSAVPCYNTFQQGFGIQGLSFTTLDSAVFFQDDFHVSRRLTLDLGLRWEHETFPNAVTPNPAVSQTGHMPSDNKDFGPRVGFAWDIFGTGKTVVRGGGGIYYGRIINGNIFNALVNTGVVAGSQISTTFQASIKNSSNVFVPNPQAPLYPNVIANFTPQAGTSNIVFFAPDARLPQIDQFDLVIEHQIAQNTVVSLSYIGTIGRFLPLAQDINLPTPTNVTVTLAGQPPINLLKGPALPVPGSTFTIPEFIGARPNTAFNQMSQISTIVRSNYNAAVLQLTRRMTKGLQLQVSYTFAHALDDDQISSATLSGNTPQNPFNIKGDYGNSNFDIRQKTVVAAVWQPDHFAKSDSAAARWLLSGWTLSPVVVGSTGLPFSPSVSGNVPSTGGGGTTTGVIGAAGSSRVPFFARNSFRMPGFFNTDIRLSRDFHIWERATLQISVDYFNLFNDVNITSIGTQLFSSISGTATAPVFNYANPATATFSLNQNGNNGTFVPTPRLLQVGGRISF